MCGWNDYIKGVFAILGVRLSQKIERVPILKKLSPVIDAITMPYIFNSCLNEALKNTEIKKWHDQMLAEDSIADNRKKA